MSAASGVDLVVLLHQTIIGTWAAATAPSVVGQRAIASDTSVSHRRMKSLFDKEKAQEVYRRLKPYTMKAAHLVLLLLLGTGLYVWTALKNMCIEARKAPFIALASVATIIYAGFTYNQWQVMRGQLEEMKTASTIIRAQLRAKLKVAMLAEPMQEGWFMTPTITNAGQTEAKNLSSWDDGGFYTSDAPQDYNFIQIRGSKRSSISHSVAQGEQLQQPSIIISNDDVRKCVGGEGKFIVWGYLEYGDVFDKIHHEHYCFNVIPNGAGDFAFKLYRQQCNSSD
jgi:hypothetical protein